MSNPDWYETLYIDEAQDHPVPLPTPHDINGLEHVLYDAPGRRLIQKYHRFAVKFGTNVQPTEAQNMLLVARSTTVPTPQVYAIYQVRKPEGISTYIVMQYLPGRTLQDLWSSIDHARKESIARTLRTYFDELQRLQHSSYFGPVKGGPTPNDDDMFALTPDGSKEKKTPFATEDELIKGLVWKYEVEGGERMAPRPTYYKHVLPRVLCGLSGVPHFSQGDLQRKNVIVLPDDTIYIIDWEFAT